jgi:large subunit ribosomal protein L21
VLLVGDGDKISVGQPNVKGASVSAEIVEHRRGEKLRIFKFKRRREYRRRRGHRDELTRIRVTAIKG